MADDILYVGTYGPEDATRATLVFAAAIRMRESKKVPVRVALLGEGARLIDPDTAKKIQVTGVRPAYATIHDMIVAAQRAGVECHV
jgi:predicted peroxiredoxin